jgi:hypothetical protein
MKSNLSFNSIYHCLLFRANSLLLIFLLVASHISYSCPHWFTPFDQVSQTFHCFGSQKQNPSSSYSLSWLIFCAYMVNMYCKGQQGSCCGHFAVKMDIVRNSKTLAVQTTCTWCPIWKLNQHQSHQSLHWGGAAVVHKCWKLMAVIL